MKTSCKFYSFLRAVRGNWRNAIFVSLWLRCLYVWPGEALFRISADSG